HFGSDGELSVWLLGAALVVGYCCWSKHLPWQEHCPEDLAVVFQSDAHMERGVRESDDARPIREVLWRSGENEPPGKPRPAHVNLRWKIDPHRWFLGELAAVPLYPRGPCTDWEGGPLPRIQVFRGFLNRALALRAAATTAATG